MKKIYSLLTGCALVFSVSATALPVANTNYDEEPIEPEQKELGISERYCDSHFKFCIICWTNGHCDIVKWGGAGKPDD